MILTGIASILIIPPRPCDGRDITRHTAKVCAALAESQHWVAGLIECVATNYTAGAVRVDVAIPKGHTSDDVHTALLKVLGQELTVLSGVREVAS